MINDHIGYEETSEYRRYGMRKGSLVVKEKPSLKKYFHNLVFEKGSYNLLCKKNIVWGEGLKFW